MSKQPAKTYELSAAKSNTDVAIISETIYTAPGMPGSVGIRVIDCPSTGFEVVYEDRTQLINHTRNNVAKAQIILQLTEAFTKFGHQMPAAQAIGTMAALIYEDYGALRFRDIDHAFTAQAKGQIKVDTTTYGQSINVQTVLKIMKAYSIKRNQWLERFRSAERKRRKEIDSSLIHTTVPPVAASDSAVKGGTTLIKGRIERLRDRLGVSDLAYIEEE